MEGEAVFPMSVMLRLAQRGEGVALADLYNDYVSNSHRTFDTQRVPLSDRQAWLESHQETGPHRLHVAVEHDQVVGCAGITLSNDASLALHERFGFRRAGRIAEVPRKAGRFRQTGEPFCGSTDPYSAGNGSLMRLAPVVLFHHPDRQACVHYAAESSRTTHGALEAVDACRTFAHILSCALDGGAKSDVLSAAKASSTSERLNGVADGLYAGRPANEIRGARYVVDSIEAAMWCFDRTDRFRSAVLTAANLGDDADTTAAIYGQVAGAFYGAGAIPERWRDLLAMRAEIEDLADALRSSSL